MLLGSMAERRTLAKLKGTFQGTKALPTSEVFFKKVEEAQGSEEGKITCAREDKKEVDFTCNGSIKSKAY